jgi:hypothetical protein
MTPHPDFPSSPFQSSHITMHLTISFPGASADSQDMLGDSSVQTKLGRIPQGAHARKSQIDGDLAMAIPICICCFWIAVLRAIINTPVGLPKERCTMCTCGNLRQPRYLTSKSPRICRHVKWWEWERDSDHQIPCSVDGCLIIPSRQCYFRSVRCTDHQQSANHLPRLTFWPYLTFCFLSIRATAPNNSADVGQAQ